MPENRINTTASATASKTNRFRKVASIVIVYQLIAIFLAPNAHHALGERLRPFFEPYWHAFEFASQWNFFAPEPGPAPLFLRYEIFNSDQSTLVVDQLPEYPDPYFLRDRQIRRLNVMRFLMRDDSKIFGIIVPYLCKQYPTADSISLKKVFYTIPTPEQIVSGERTLDDEVGAQQIPLGTVTCEGRR